MTLEATFSALADPTRRTLLQRLETGEQTLSDLGSRLPISLMAIQKHVRVRTHGLRHAADWLQNAEVRWNAALDRLGEVLEEEKQK
jgi:DNA-binding transcriptional ArsR family regulator